jgi:predicted transcriptional regulator
MNSEAVKEVLDTLFSHLEKLETQTEGIMQYLKEKKKVTDAQLAPYLEQAGKASNVRWRAARVRIEYLIAGAEREEEKQREAESERCLKPSPITRT